MPVLVGTSGWQYRDWRGVLYPPGLAQRRWLEYYASQYATVENNGAFYRLPGPQTFADWRARTPGDFVMAVKASRYLTHVRRLHDSAGPVGRLLGAAAGLGDRLGPVLLQLPPNLPADPDALDECLREFAAFRPPGEPQAAPEAQPGPRARTQRSVRVAVEFRHESWWTDEIRELLARHRAALCWADRLGRPVSPLWRTADWGYLRLHEGAAQPWPRYGERALSSWAQRIAGTWPDDADVFVFFNNDPGGAAIYDAAAFASIARQAGRQVSRAAIPGDQGS
jgi:uncharacterized protein YecE (DUF72 family)